MKLSTSAQYNLRSYRLKESDGKGPPAPVQRCGVSDNALGKLVNWRGDSSDHIFMYI